VSTSTTTTAIGHTARLSSPRQPQPRRSFAPSTPPVAAFGAATDSTASSTNTASPREPSLHTPHAPSATRETATAPAATKRRSRANAPVGARSREVASEAAELLTSANSRLCRPPACATSVRNTWQPRTGTARELHGGAFARSCVRGGSCGVSLADSQAVSDAPATEGRGSLSAPRSATLASSVSQRRRPSRRFSSCEAETASKRCSNRSTTRGAA
jgi:hypothetical protein